MKNEEMRVFAYPVQYSTVPKMRVFAYPMQYSTVPKMLRDFIIENNELWERKKIFVIATMGLFSGDGAGVLGRLLQ